MNVLIFGGESPRHEQWVRELADVLQSDREETRFLDYEHWARGETDIDLEHEVARTAQLADGLGEYIVVAKSIGTIVTALAVSRSLLAPQRCVFLGFPLARVPSVDGIDAAISLLPPTVFVHNEFDKVGTARAVQNYLEAHEPQQYTFEIIANNATHDYVDYAHIAQLALAPW